MTCPPKRPLLPPRLESCKQKSMAQHAPFWRSFLVFRFGAGSKSQRHTAPPGPLCNRGRSVLRQAMAIDFTLPPTSLAVAHAACASSCRSGSRPPRSACAAKAAGGRATRRSARRPRRPASGRRTCRAEWGGMGLGPLAMAFVSAECGRTQLGAYVLNCHAPDEGNMHTLLHYRDRRAEGALPPPAGRRQGALVLRDDGARGRRLGSDRHPDARRAGRRQLGHQRAQVVHLGRARRQRSRSSSRKTDPDADPPQARNTAFLVDLDNAGLQHRARRRDHGRARQPLRDPLRERARAGGAHARRPRPGAPARPGAARPGAPRALHALDRQRRGRARDAREARPRAAAARRRPRRQAGSSRR